MESVRSTVKETDTDYVPLDNERGLGFDSTLVSDARFHRWFGTEDLHLPRKKDHGGSNPSASFQAMVYQLCTIVLGTIGPGAAPGGLTKFSLTVMHSVNIQYEKISMCMWKIFL